MQPIAQRLAYNRPQRHPTPPHQLNRNSDHPFYTEAYVDVSTSSVDMSSSEVWAFFKKTNGRRLLRRGIR